MGILTAFVYCTEEAAIRWGTRGGRGVRWDLGDWRVCGGMGGRPASLMRGVKGVKIRVASNQ